MKGKTREYDQLKGEWSARASPEDLEFIRGNVLKDVLRTDRAHPYYAGSEDSPHLTALTDLLTTFAITHPQVWGSIFFIFYFAFFLNSLTCRHAKGCGVKFSEQMICSTLVFGILDSVYLLLSEL